MMLLFKETNSYEYITEYLRIRNFREKEGKKIEIIKPGRTGKK